MDPVLNQQHFTDQGMIELFEPMKSLNDVRGRLQNSLERYRAKSDRPNAKYLTFQQRALDDIEKFTGQFIAVHNGQQSIIVDQQNRIHELRDTLAELNPRNPVQWSRLKPHQYGLVCYFIKHLPKYHEHRPAVQNVRNMKMITEHRNTNPLICEFADVLDGLLEILPETEFINPEFEIKQTTDS